MALFGETGPRVSTELKVMAIDMTNQLNAALRAFQKPMYQNYPTEAKAADGITDTPESTVNYVRPNLDKVVELNNQTPADKIEQSPGAQPVSQMVTQLAPFGIDQHQTAQLSDEQMDQETRIAQAQAVATATYNDIANAGVN